MQIQSLCSYKFFVVKRVLLSWRGKVQLTALVAVYSRDHLLLFCRPHPFINFADSVELLNNRWAKTSAQTRCHKGGGVVPCDPWTGGLPAIAALILACVAFYNSLTQYLAGIGKKAGMRSQVRTIRISAPCSWDLLAALQVNIMHRYSTVSIA
jgi:hypothetical protein